MAKKRAKKSSSKKNGNRAALEFEGIKFWSFLDKLHGSIAAAEYKHVVLGLLFLKYTSDAFQGRREELEALCNDDDHSEYLPDDLDQVVEDRDEYASQNVFWVPKKARWSEIQAEAKTPDIAKRIDDAMFAIEKDNSRLRGVLPRNYATHGIPPERLGELIDLISGIGLGDAESRSKDILGRVYEYFLGKFASAEGKFGGEFYTPSCVVRLLVEMLEPYKGRVFDPCCGSGGMFVQALKFVTAHASGNGNGTRAKRNIAIYGQESNYTTWRLCQMNLAIRGIDGDIKRGDSFLDDKHKDLKADFILANPPFNMEDWGYSKVKNDVRWRRFDQSGSNAQFSLPPGGERKQKDGSFIHVDGGNANYAWILHFLHHLAPHGTAGFVLANDSLTSNTSGEGDIRKAIIEADLVDCVIAMPGQLFYTTQIPVCLWFLTRNKGTDKARGFHARQGKTLFINARKKGHLIDRTHRELSPEDLAEISRTYHAWRGEAPEGQPEYEDVAGFCMSASTEEIEKHSFVLTPGRYVGAEDIEDDGEPFEEKMALG